MARFPRQDLNIGSNARSLAISPAGGIPGDGLGRRRWFAERLSIFRHDLIHLTGNVDLGVEDGSYGSYIVPGFNILQSRWKSFVCPGAARKFSRRHRAPFPRLRSSDRQLLATPPIPLPNAEFLNGLLDPQAPFSYVGNSGPTTYGISVYQVDLSTGMPSQPTPISSPFYPQWILLPVCPD